MDGWRRGKEDRGKGKEGVGKEEEHGVQLYCTVASVMNLRYSVHCSILIACTWCVCGVCVWCVWCGCGVCVCVCVG